MGGPARCVTIRPRRQCEVGSLVRVVTVRTRVISLLLPAVVGGSVLFTAGCASDPEVVRAVPTFPSSERAGASAPKPRDTLLPADCDTVFSGVDMSALLGQPIDSIKAKAVVGVSAPAVGRLEKVTCLYRRSATKTGPTDVDLNLYAYTDAQAADHHIDTNIAVERASSHAVEQLSIGTARAVLLAQDGQSILFVVNGRSAVCLTMRNGVVPDDQMRPIMLDLAQRVLPNLAPEPAPAPTVEPR